MPKKQFYNSTPEEIMQADLTKIPDLQLHQYIGLHIYANFVAGLPWPEADPPYQRCLIEVVRRMSAQEREQLLQGNPVEKHLPAVSLYVFEQLGEEQQLLMGRIASRLRRGGKSSPKTMEMIPSSLIYQFVQRAISRAPEGIFDTEQSDFPLYSEQKDGFNASMEMRPHENLPAIMLPNYGEILVSMNQKLDQLGDIAVDVMDIILSRYIRKTGETVTVTTEEILRMRGIRPKTKDGYSAGFRPEDRRRIGNVLLAMDNLWITVGEMKVYPKGGRAPQRFQEKSRLMMITGITEQVALAGESTPLIWQVRMGEVFASLLSSEMATQYALLSTKTLQYDPYHQRWEKRLSRYFHPLWRIRQADESFSQPIRVSTLLEAIGMPMDRKNPQRTRDRFEQALDRLAEDGILGGWSYLQKDSDEDAVSQRGWVSQWLKWRVSASPNADLLKAYRAEKNLLSPPEPPPVPANSSPEINVRESRKQRGLTQAQLAEAMGVSRSLIAQIERGARAASDDFTAAFLSWQQANPLFPPS